MELLRDKEKISKRSRSWMGAAGGNCSVCVKGKEGISVTAGQEIQQL